MWHQPQQAINLPKAICDFVAFVNAASKDKSLLQPFVEAAAAIQVSQESIDAVCKEAEAAQRIIDECAQKQKELAEQYNDLCVAQVALGKVKTNVEQRELMLRKQQDDQAAMQKAQVAEAQRLQSLQAQVTEDMAKNAKLSASLDDYHTRVDNEVAEVTRREQAVIKREQAIAVAHAALNGAG